MPQTMYTAMGPQRVATPDDANAYRNLALMERLSELRGGRDIAQISANAQLQAAEMANQKTRDYMELQQRLADQRAQQQEQSAQSAFDRQMQMAQTERGWQQEDPEFQLSKMRSDILRQQLGLLAGGSDGAPAAGLPDGMKADTASMLRQMGIDIKMPTEPYGVSDQGILDSARSFMQRDENWGGDPSDVEADQIVEQISSLAEYLANTKNTSKEQIIRSFILRFEQMLGEESGLLGREDMSAKLLNKLRNMIGVNTAQSQALDQSPLAGIESMSPVYQQIKGLR